MYRVLKYWRKLSVLQFSEVAYLFGKSHIRSAGVTLTPSGNSTPFRLLLLLGGLIVTNLMQSKIGDRIVLRG